MNIRRLRRIGYFVLGVVLALVSPVDEIILITAAFCFLYRFVRSKVDERYRKARALGHSKLDRR